MVILVYWASVTSNRKIDGDQARLRNMIESLKLESQWIDITTSRNLMVEMRNRCGNAKALPPQIFNGEVYLGNVDDMDQSIEEDRLMQWLKIDSNQQSSCNGDTVYESRNGDPILSDTVDAKPVDEVSPNEPNGLVTSNNISRATIEMNVASSNSSIKMVDSKVDEERRRRILGLPPLENSDMNAEPPTNIHNSKESCESEDVSKLRSRFEVKDGA